MAEIENIGEVVDSLATIIRDPHVIPDTTDQVIQEIITSGNAANYSFATPPSSPGESLFSSRCGSLKSIRWVKKQKLLTFDDQLVGQLSDFFSGFLAINRGSSRHTQELQQCLQCK